MLIAIEGIDGAGKQTLAEALSHALTEQGRSVARVAFPRYETQPFGAAISAALDGSDPTLLSSVEALAFAFACDRWHYWTSGRAAFGYTVSTITIADRWCASNAAYGTARAGVEHGDRFARWVADLEFGQFGLPRPALTILLATGSGMAGQQRRSRDGDDGDAFEADDSLQVQALNAYRELARSEWGGPWLIIDPIDDDGNRRNPTELAAEALAAIA